MRHYRLHVVSLPHVITTKTAPWCACAYTQKVLNFCKMMHDLGHEVFHYGTEGSVVECTEHVDVFSKDDQDMFWPNCAKRWEDTQFEIEWDTGKPYWQLHNTRSIYQIRKRLHPKDFVCLIAGTCQQPIAEAFADTAQTIEYGIGYRGAFSKFRVYESYSHLHRLYGNGSSDPDGSYYYTVIPNYYDPADFQVDDVDLDCHGNYLLFVGRMNLRKGLAVLQDMLPELQMRGLKLLCAGQGATQDAPGQITYEGGRKLIGDNVHFLGLVDFERRRQLMANAKAFICPTKYVEPFGGVAVEAQLCGCPVISTDWGAFTETVEQGKTGYRCYTLQEFLDAVDDVDKLDRRYIRQRALAEYTLGPVGQRYQRYLDRVYDLWDRGWSTLRKDDDTASEKE